MAESQDGMRCNTENEQVVTPHNNMDESHRLNIQQRGQPTGFHGKYRDGQNQSASWGSASLGESSSDWDPWDPGILTPGCGQRSIS